MPGARKLEIRIVGDAKSVLGAFGEVEAGSSKLGGSFAGLGTAATAGFAIVAGSAIGVVGALFEIGSKFDEAYDKIRVGTGATGDDLAALQQDFKNVVSDVPTDFGKASDAITGLVSILGVDAGPQLDQLSEQFLELSRITGTDLKSNLDSGAKALINWNVPIGEYGNKLDEVFRASQLTGVSFGDLTTQLNDTGPVLRDLGFNFEDTVALLGALGKAGIDTGDVMPAFSKTLATAAKEGKDAGQVFRDTFQGIQNAPDATTAAGIAMDVFGAKAGPKLAGLIREGKLSFDDLEASIVSGQDTILGAGKDTQDFGEKWTLLKNRVFVALEPIAMKLFNAIGDAMDALPGIIAAVTPYFEKFRDVLAGIVTWIGDNLPIVAGAIAGVLVPAFIAWAISAGAAAVATIIAAAPFIALGAALAALGAGIVYAYENFDGFRAVIDATASWLVETAWPALQTFFGGIIAAGQAVVSWFQTNWSTIAAVFQTTWDILLGIWNMVGVPLWDAMQLYIQLMIDWFKIEWAVMSTVFEAVWDIARDFWNEVGAPIFSSIQSVIQDLINWFQLAWGLISTTFSTVWDIVEAAWNNVGKPIFDAIKRVIDGVRSAAETAADVIGSIIDWGTSHGGVSKTGSIADVGKRASGGPMLPGHSYVVGENHPELLTMGSMGGYVHPDLAGGGGGINIYGNVVLPGVKDVDGFMRELSRRAKRNGGDLSYAGI